MRDLWNRVRGLGQKVEEELYDFSEEEELEEEPRGRNTLIALINAFLTMWKATHATVVERSFGVLGFAGLLWLIVGDRGLGVRRWPLRAVWTFTVNMGVGNLRRLRTWPLMLVFAMGGLISFRAVFSALAAQRPRPVPPPEDETEGR
jgi:hypothetical protein